MMLKILKLDELVETSNLYQLINSPTNFREGGKSCIDLIITDQPNCFIDSGTYPSPDEHCQRKIFYGKLNVLAPYPPPYKRTIWEYSEACPLRIKADLESINWGHKFRGLCANKMTDLLSANYIPYYPSAFQTKLLNVMKEILLG